MKSRFSTCIFVLTLLSALSMPVPLAAQEQQKEHIGYKLIDLGTFGGPNSSVFVGDNNYNPVLNYRGTVTGAADTPAPDPFPAFCFSDCFVSHAFQLQNGVMTDLPGLKRGVSSMSAWISANGLIAGWSENGLTDPDPSFPSGFPVSHGVLWKHGRITDLGTLDGGHESVALAVNSSGQVVGAADSRIQDPTPMTASNFGWFTKATRAFLSQDGVMQDLGTLGGTDAVALLVNERGQIVGDSFTNTTPSAYCAQIGFPLTTGAFIWENGTIENLGSFGGTCTFAFDLNNRGQVIGGSTLTEDQEQHPFLWDRGSMQDLGTFGGSRGTAIAINQAGEITGWANLPDQTPHAFLWKNGTMIDLGTVEGDPCSIGYSINVKWQVVGISVPGCDFSNFNAYRAFLSEDGRPPVDLNTLIPIDSALHLAEPETINDRGEIAGVGVDANGNQHAFLLIPCSPSDASCQNAAAGQAVPGNVPRPAVQNLSTGQQSNPIRGLFGRRLGLGRSAEIVPKATSDAEVILGASVNVSPASLTFPTVAIGGASSAETVTLKNIGTGTVIIKSIAITGIDAQDYAQVHNCGTPLPAGATCNINVTFKPKTSGIRKAALNISDNAPGSPQKVSLTGIGTTARLSPSSLNFGRWFVGQVSSPQSVTLTNVGTSALTLDTIAINGPQAADFAQTHSCKSSLAPNASCTINVNFKPQGAGTRAAALNISDNAAGSPQSIFLSGTGVAGRCLRLGGECAPIFPPCCPGLVCTYEGDRAFCEPGAAENFVNGPWHKRANTSADGILILKDKLLDTLW